MANDKVKIKNLRKPKKGERTVPSAFIVAGTAKGDTIAGVKGAIKKLGSSDPPRKGTMIRWEYKPTADGDQFRWLILFRLLDPSLGGKYQLDVRGRDRTGAEIPGCKEELDEPFKVRPYDVPSIQYPTDGQDITDEKGDFTAFGVMTADIVSVTITPDGGDPIQSDDVFSDLSYPFWAAHFDLSNINGPIDLTLTVTDSQGNTTTTRIHIET